MLLAGELRYTVTLERKEKGHKDSGQPTESWKPVVRGIPCSIETVGGGEFRRGRHMDATTTKLIRMWHPLGSFKVKTTDRLVNCDEDEELNIVRAYDPTGLKRELFVEVRESANG